MNIIEKQRERIIALKEQINYIKTLDCSKINEAKLLKLKSLLKEDEDYLNFLTDIS